MKVSDILEATFDDDRGEVYPAGEDEKRAAAEEYFDNHYIEIGAAFSVGFDELEDTIRNIANKQRDVNLQNELAVLSRFAELDDQDEYYVPREQAKQLDELDNVIVGDGSLKQIAQAIKEFLAILHQHMISKNVWMEAEANKFEVNTDHGMRDRDFM
jgi:uncharacterized phage infection (PIP) family protein YhgE